ncbi:hypothetical protein FOA52_016228 [Chlamydomonas sp. UWO 241]|nr:hypothetical protein FOA52_016228 [Chlamydomonas sp. UWO 241]
MRNQVDGAVQVVVGPRLGANANQLRSVLLRWPGVRDLTLLDVGSASSLAPLSTASLAGLTTLTVRELLGPGSSADVKVAAALALASLSVSHAQNQAAIATAGAIPALVQLLGPDSSADVQEAAKAALHTLALNHAQNRAAISDAGGVLALVEAAIHLEDEGHSRQPSTWRTRATV